MCKGTDKCQNAQESVPKAARLVPKKRKVGIVNILYSNYIVLAPYSSVRRIALVLGWLDYGDDDIERIMQKCLLRLPKVFGQANK